MLTDILLKQGNISEEQFRAIKEKIKNSQESEEEILIKENISEKTIFKLKKEILNIYFLENISEDEISDESLNFIPQETAKTYNLLPISFEKNVLEVGTPFPENFSSQQILNFLARQYNISTNVVLITISNFNNCFKKYEKLRKKKAGTSFEEAEKKIEEKEEISSIQAGRIKEDAPTIIKLVNRIIADAIEKKAADIHIEPLEKKTRVRLRLDGVLHEILSVSSNMHPAIIGRIKILSKLKIDETRMPQDGRFSGKINNIEIDFRVASLPTPFGEKIAIRILDPETGKQTLEESGILNHSPDFLIEKSLNLSHGMILVTGPTGSGKTTTLYSFLSHLNKPEVNIISLEDPVEYKYEGINQSQVQPEIGYTFASGLRQMLRQDPDIIMLGEIRDSETASLAVQAALTGHLVFSTLHTNSAAGVIPRLIDLGVNHFLISSALSLLIGQRLLRKMCLHCKIKKQVPPIYEKAIKLEAEKIPNFYKNKYSKVIEAIPFSLYYPQGCKRCGHTGFKGRMGIFEIIEITNSLKNLILKSPSELEVWEEAKKQNVITVFQSGILQMLNGDVSFEEVLRVCRT